MRFLPYGTQSINADDKAAIEAVLNSPFLTAGPKVAEFEAGLCAYTGAKEAISVSNGTAALHLAFLSQDLGPKDVVIVPSITFLASANGAAFCGAKVIFADVDPMTGLLTEATFEEALSRLSESYPDHHFAGVVAVHLTGRPVDMAPIHARAKALGGFVIEDAAHALGTHCRHGTVGDGRYSDMTILSFHPVKTITTGEGGAILCNDPQLAARLRALRAHGIERNPDHFSQLEAAPWVYEMQSLGYNYRLPDLNCALGISQLARLETFVQKRLGLIEAYQDALKDLPVHWQTPHKDERIGFHLFSVLIDFAALNTTRQAVMEGLKARQIGSQVHYIPVHIQPYWVTAQLGLRPLMGANHYYERTLSLPLFADMEMDDVGRVVTALTEVLGL